MLEMLLEEFRGKTLRLLQVDAVAANWTPPGTRNSMLWHGGHIFCIVERLFTHATSGDDSVPATILTGWWPRFGWDPPTSAPTDAPPALATIVEQLQAQAIRWQPRLRELSAAQQAALLTPAIEGWEGATCARAIIHALHDEACHQGEIWLLQKLYKQR
ncbi:MAG TPA: DinB family protein [Pirellulaceae bacterium]|nr:DinB family protein [Pirellulaceae bacterium]